CGVASQLATSLWSRRYSISCLVEMCSTWMRLPVSRARLTSRCVAISAAVSSRSEEHTSELQSRGHLVCRLLLEKKKKILLLNLRELSPLYNDVMFLTMMLVDGVMTAVHSRNRLQHVSHSILI